MEASSFLSILFFSALIMLVLVTGGILYLTSAEWRDRRRQDRDKKGAKN